jgi:hypothetical protein
MDKRWTSDGGDALWPGLFDLVNVITTNWAAMSWWIPLQDSGWCRYGLKSLCRYKPLLHR